MKKIKNTKINPQKRVSQKVKSNKKSVCSTRAKIVGPKHLRLVEHKHTGKLIHHRNTSHLSLAIILFLLGLFLFITSNNTVKAQFSSGDVKVGLIVPGPAPKVGATIISPVDGTKITNKNTSEVSGTCEAGTFVVVKDNGSLVGSTSCTSAGIFILQIQLWSGNNTLSALNYDNLNQSGPETKSVNIM